VQESSLGFSFGGHSRAARASLRPCSFTPGANIDTERLREHDEKTTLCNLYERCDINSSPDLAAR